MQETKDVELGGSRYQIGRFKAREGSWIVAQLLTTMLPAFLERALKTAGANLGSNRPTITEEDFASIQGTALAVVRKYNAAGVPMPVFIKPDTFVLPELEYDLAAVMALTVEALVFNVSRFFDGGGLDLIMSSLAQVGLFSAVPSPSNTQA